VIVRLGQLLQMLLLAIDTSGKLGSIALARGHEDGSCSVIEVVPLAGGTFSAQLVPEIAALLTKHRFGKHEIDAFAVASGPGSFTGLRVGLAAIKALAEILGKPIAAVSLLEVLALAGGTKGKVCAALDAGRGEIYCGEYEVAGDSVQVLREQLLTREELVAAARGWKIVTPDAALVATAAAAGLSAVLVEPLSAGAVARLGWRRLLRGHAVSPEQLEANYIRRSDAEIFGAKG
jgi:tRNA threonylcarbamoyladenosine biosynthesis protein TsaB